MADKKTALGRKLPQREEREDTHRLKRKVTTGETQRLNVNVPSALYDDFQQVARRKGLPMSAIIIRFLHRYVEKNTGL